MRESEFRDWLETNGANTESGRNTRVHAVRTIEKKLADLGFHYPDLEAAWEAGRFADIREAISRLRTDFDSGGERFRVLMPESEKPRNRLSNWRSWLMQYGQFLEGHASANDADRIRRFVLENHIEPARERDGQSAELVVKDVNDALGLHDAWPNICQAMRGRKFHEMADVPPPQSFGADMSTATRFVFDLAKEDYWALRTLRESLGEPIGQTNKIASFALEDGRQLALDLEAARTQIWLEGSYGHWSAQQVTVTEYPAQKSRSSNLPKRLRHDVPDRREVSKIELPNAEVLKTLLDRYFSKPLFLNSQTLERLKLRFLERFDNFAEDGGFSNHKEFLRKTGDNAKREFIKRMSEANETRDSQGIDELGREMTATLFSANDGRALLRGDMHLNLAKRVQQFPGHLERAAGAMLKSRDIGAREAEFARSVFEPVFQNDGTNPFADLRTISSVLSAGAAPNEVLPVYYMPLQRAYRLLCGKALFGNRIPTEDEFHRANALGKAVLEEIRDWGWNPRDLWDVQAFLSETCQSALENTMVGNELDPVPVWLVTSLWGEEDGLPRFIARGEWSLLTDTGSANNRRVREMHVGDRIFLKDFMPRATDLSFDAGGGIVTANRFRAEGTITDVSDDGLRVGVEWQEWEEPRTWYFYTSNHAVWRLRDPGEKESADRLRRFLLNYEEQDYDWFLNAPFWRDRLFGAPTQDEDTTVQPTNLILYGPPGTGKTYRTAREAVQLCDGGADYPDDAEGRAALMRRYRELVESRQVELVTFHQSFSYEEFIEGLRPDTDGSNEGGGFSLKAQSGLFARIADRAQKRVRRGDGRILVEGRKIFKMSLGQSNDPHSNWVFEDSLEQGYALFGFKDVDWSDSRFASKDGILSELERLFPDERITPQMGMVKSPDRFRNQLGVGDIIVASKGLNVFRAIGIVEGEYEYAPRPDGRYTHRRKVSWLWSDPEGVPVAELSPDTRFSLDTIYELPRGRLNLKVLERLLNSGSEEIEWTTSEEGELLPHVLIIDEINRANISKVFGELITLIEPDKRLGMPNALKVRLPYSKREFGVPANLHIIGTMNTADRSIALLDTALRRRFRFEEMAPDTSVEAFLDAEEATRLPLADVLETMNRRIEYLVDRDHRIGHAFFIGCKTKSQVDAVMRDKVIPLLQEYFFEDWNRLAAVLGEKDKGGNFLECKTIEDPMGEGGEPLKSWRVLDSFEEGAYSRLLKRKPSGAISAEVVA
ncbi:AAA family ATPase [Qipengyuania sp. JC766]|uniref:AAA family ATPase n=1 Tax=Qipengyuania sp. JC766 TaxID=3232139 RepID=UPI003458B2AC